MKVFYKGNEINMVSKNAIINKTTKVNSFDLFVMAGQSNMAGQSEIYREFRVPLYKSYNYSYSLNTFTEVKHPFGEWINERVDDEELKQSWLENPTSDTWWQMEGAAGGQLGLPYASLSPYFASKYYAVTKHPTILTQCACGNTTIAEWLPSNNKGRYRLAVKKINSSISYANKMNVPIRGKYLIWLQGENDGMYKTGTEKYKTRFLQFWSALKQDCGLEKCFIIRVAKYREGKYDDKPIIEAQEQLALENDDIELVTRITGYLEYPSENPKNPTIQDGTTVGYPYIDHYTIEGYKLVGETVGERIGNYINTGIMPELEPEPYEGEIMSSSEIVVAEYKFDHTIYENYVPEFNEGYTYRVSDIVEGNITTRKIIGFELPTIMRFGSFYSYDEINLSSHEATARELCLTEVIHADTRNITDVRNMFYYCQNMTSIPALHISNVPSVYCMFYRCDSLTKIDMTNYDLSETTDAENFVRNCINLRSIDARGIKLSKLTNMFTMFIGCTKLEEIKGCADWDISQVNCMTSTFYNCVKLIELDLSKWVVDNVTNVGGLFKGCNLISLNLSNWNLANCTDFTEMMKDTKIQNLYLNNVNDESIINILMEVDSVSEANPMIVYVDEIKDTYPTKIGLMYTTINN
jgi:surface protein